MCNAQAARGDTFWQTGWAGLARMPASKILWHAMAKVNFAVYIWACFNLQSSAEKKGMLCILVLLQRCLALSYNVSCLLKLLKILQM